MSSRHAASAVVLGSVHMDLIASAGRLPGSGESVIGGAFAMAPGGKAGNQAIQLARCGISTRLITRLGDDFFGRELLKALREAGVDVSLVSFDDVAPTGASVVMVSPADYASIIAPGAAAGLTASDVDYVIFALREADALVVQLELPAEISSYAARRARDLGKQVILNASPIPGNTSDISPELWRLATTIIANGSEASRLAYRPVQPSGLDEARLLASDLRKRMSVQTVVITLGAIGAAASSPEGAFAQDAFQVEVIDTVGAGDAFLGALTASLIQGGGLPIAMRRAAAAGALAVGRRGAYDALPTAAAIDGFLARHER
jgi:ribokinase